MKAVINGVEVEGTPREIEEYRMIRKMPEVNLHVEIPKIDSEVIAKSVRKATERATEALLRESKNRKPKDDSFHFHPLDFKNRRELEAYKERLACTK